MNADDTAKHIIKVMKGHRDPSNERYIAHKLEEFAESRVVQLREMIRLLKEEIRELQLL